MCVVYCVEMRGVYTLNLLEKHLLNCEKIRRKVKFDEIMVLRLGFGILIFNLYLLKKKIINPSWIEIL